MLRASRDENNLKKLKIKTLATTIVEECNKEETGVGPSMALGSQEQKTIIDDLANTLKKAKKVVSVNKKLKRQKSPIRFKNIACKDLF